MADSSLTSPFGDLKPEQKKAIHGLLKGRDVLAVLPTGFGKSRIYQTFASLKDDEENGAVVLVVSPLQSIIEDQCEILNAVDFPAADLSTITVKELQDCKYKILFGSAEAVLSQEFQGELKNSSSRLHQQLCGLVVDECHTVETWSGKRKRTKRKGADQAFRSAYGKLSTLRSLCKEGVPLLALTATADKETQSIICKQLLMDKPEIIFVSPNRDNLRFTVMKTDKEEMHKHLDWIVELVKSHGRETPKTIIFCNTLKDVSVVVNQLVFKLGKYAYNPSTSQKREDLVLGIFHSMSWKSNKDAILKSLRESGKKRVIVATSALSMGVNFSDVRYILNWGPARSLLGQHQEAGRAGRDGELSHVIIVYHGHQLIHCEDDVKEFIKANGCLRVSAYKPFDANVKPLNPGHNCCSNCAVNCECKTDACKQKLCFESHCDEKIVDRRLQVTREVREEDRECFTNAFEEIRESYPSGYNVFGATSAHAFSDYLISAINEHCHKLFTINDIYSYLPVFSIHHAIAILEVLDETFSDIPHIDLSILTIYDHIELDQPGTFTSEPSSNEEQFDDLFEMFQEELDMISPDASDSDDSTHDESNLLQ